MDPASDAAEAQHFRRILASFDQYRRWALAANQRRRKDYYRLPSLHQTLLGRSYVEKLDEVDDRVRRNADVVDEIVAQADGMGFAFGDEVGEVEVRQQEAEKVRSSIRQMVRDWSLAGREEREACHDPILAGLDDEAKRVGGARLKVLVPGAGLGRLAWEVANRGHSALGVEFSYHMLLTSNLILNSAKEVDEWTIYPYVHSFSHHPSSASLLRSVSIPDVLPSTLPPQGEMGMAAGDFTQIFSSPQDQGTWDVVASCFFLDTARNVVEYLLRIYSLLKPGGVLLSVDATTWHFEESADDKDVSVELSVDEVRNLMRSVGFHIFHEAEVKTTYAGNSMANLKTEYTASVTFARKASDASTS